MRNIKILHAIFILLIPLSVFSQTKEETINWINVKFIEYQIKIPGLTQVYKAAVKLNYSKDPLLLIYIPNLELYYMASPLDIAKVSTERAPAGNLNITILGSERKIMTGTINPRNLDIVDYKFIDNFNIMMEGPDEEIMRMKKALEHLIQIIGGKLQDDDLFK